MKLKQRNETKTNFEMKGKRKTKLEIAKKQNKKKRILILNMI